MSRVTSGSARTAPGNCLFAFAILAFSALYGAAPAAAQMVLDSGRTHVVTPAQTECLEIEVISPEIELLPVAIATCNTATGTADVEAWDGGSTRDVDAVASSVFQLFFRVEDAGNANGPSQVPIHVRVPTEWAVRLFNDHVTEFGGSASMDILLQLRQDPELFPGGKRGVAIERTTILGATHGGILGCLSLPTDPASLVSTAISCTLATYQRLRGNSLASLNAVVETGRTYNLELSITGRIHSGPLTTHQAEASSNVVPVAPGLKWSQMVVTIGTDPAALVAGLEEKIAGLQEQIDDLRGDLEGHTHTYLTGRGVGHNNTVAVSSPAVIPDGPSGDATVVSPQPGAGNPPGADETPKGRYKRLLNFGQ